MINVIIVDDQTLFLESMKDMFSLNTDYSCVGIAHGEDELFPLLHEHDVHVILLDVEISSNYGKDGIQIARMLKTTPKYSAIKVISMSVNTHSYVIRTLLEEIGVDGYIDKSHCSKATMFEAIKTVLSGSIYTSPSLIEKAKRILKIETLTKREKEILILIIQGKTNGEIADLLIISAKTVDNHRQSIYDKMKCKNIAMIAEQYYRYAFLHDNEYDLPNFKKQV